MCRAAPLLAQGQVAMQKLPDIKSGLTDETVTEEGETIWFRPLL
ncbi:MAG: hypothetical protein ACI85F_000587 [Bacteroidia bacterium]|jgi:hypothetical protein